MAELRRIQVEIMDAAVTLVRPGGVLAYATCSLLTEENEAQEAGFVARHPEFRAVRRQRFGPLQGGDGFFVTLLTRGDAPPTQL